VPRIPAASAAINRLVLPGQRQIDVRCSLKLPEGIRLIFPLHVTGAAGISFQPVLFARGRKPLPLLPIPAAVRGRGGRMFFEKRIGAGTVRRFLCGRRHHLGEPGSLRKWRHPAHGPVRERACRNFKFSDYGARRCMGPLRLVGPYGT
jgi:hypothetical protein